MDIRYNAPSPISELSNLHPHRFYFQGTLCNSVEGILQALKFSNRSQQLTSCIRYGYEAKSFGKDVNWQSDQTLYWKSESIGRHTKDYQDLLDDIYLSIALQSESFISSLAATKDLKLTHSLGKQNPYETVLTKYEFISRLLIIRRLILDSDLNLKSNYHDLLLSRLQGQRLNGI